MKWLLAWTLPVIASAHTLQITGVSLDLDDSGTRVTVVAHAPLLGGANPATAIPKRLKLRLDGSVFQPNNATLTRDPQFDTLTWTAVDPRNAGKLTLEAPIFPDHPEDTTIVLVKRNGELIERTALNTARPEATLNESSFAIARRFGEMGVAHILSGLDHVLFLCGLILAGGPALRLLGVVTAFTVAHSITLSLTALGVSSLSPRFVEPMIALSIVVVGLENLIRKKQDFEFRAWLAFGFGFFHGFGFAGALTEAGLPGHAMAWALAAFNIGVELGQALILVAVLPLLVLVQRSSEKGFQLITRFASIAICLAGGFWFVGRVWL